MATGSKPARGILTRAGPEATPEGGPELRPAADALFLDFDGTLAPIVPHPDDAWLAEGHGDILSATARAFEGAVAVLSGRALADLGRRAPHDLWRIGSHGDDVARPGEADDRPPAPPPADILDAARATAARFEGVFVEIKPRAVVLHYRQNPEAGPACLAAMEAAVAAGEGYELLRGKMVAEVRPEGVNKGRALHDLMQLAPFRGRRPVMVGDDVTDEAAMRAALDLGGEAVKVGEGESIARWRLSGPDAVFAWLARWTAEG